MSTTQGGTHGEEVAIGLPIAASPERVFRALTTPAELTTWFAEHANVSLAKGRYDFWGRYTLGQPDEATGRQRLLACDPPHTLRFAWRVRGADTVVTLSLRPTPTGTMVALTQDDAPPRPHYGAGLADFWSLSLLNLQAWVEQGTIGARCDYSVVPTGAVRHELDIDAPPAAVFAAIMRPEELDRYIAERAAVEPLVGGAYSYGWGDGGPVKILDLVPGERLAYSWSYEGEPGTIVTWELAGSEGGTHLTLIHSGFAPDEAYESYYTGWLEFLVRLKRMVEIGPRWQRPQMGHAARQTEAATVAAP